MSYSILNAGLNQESHVDKHLTKYISETEDIAKYMS